MTTRKRDRILALVFLAVSVFWCWAAWTTIPNTYSGPVGARGFPMMLGVLLGGLALVVLAGTFKRDMAGNDEVASEETDAIPIAVEAWAIGVPIALLIAYVVLLWALGFLIATALVVAMGLLAVGERRPLVLASLVVGLSLGIYIVFGKVLGVYLPYGHYFTLAF